MHNTTEIEKSLEDYPLIPMNDIEEEARLLAVRWVENYGTMGFDIQNRHKLASDIMNYAIRHHAKRSNFEAFAIESIKENERIHQQIGEVGNIIWRNATDYPKKSKNYICELEIMEDGLTFWPVSYVRFDADSNTWEKISRCGTDGKVTKWLDESATDKPEELQQEVERLTGR